MKMKKISIIGWTLAVLFLAVTVVGLNFSHFGSNLAGGTFDNTLYNSTLQAVQLNWTDATNTTYVSEGEYTSPVIDFGLNTEFRRLEWEGKPGTCPANMTYIDKLGGFCIDKYEASVWNADGTWNTTSNTSAWNGGSWTDSALANNAYAGSAPDKYPWVYIDQTEARTACSNAGKYLCTSEEWLAAANIKGQVYNLDALLDECTVDETTDCDWADSPGAGDACMTGSKTDCVSSEGVYDMVGNVWEWVNDTVTTVAPSPGTAGWYYPSDSGWYTSTNSYTAKYGNDGVYFAAGTQTTRAVLRGCAWGFGAHAGPFCATLSGAPSHVDSNIGFRCCSNAS